VLVRYPAGHFGIPDEDTILADLIGGDICGTAAIWQRFIGLIGFFDSSFPGGERGPRGLRVVGETDVHEIPSPALALAGGPPVPRRVVVYRPPAFFNTGDSFPVAYFIGGYGQSAEDFVRVGELMDLLIGIGAIENFYLVFLPGEGGVRGSFLLNQRVPETQAPDVDLPTSGRYEDSTLADLIPAVESVILEGRVKR